MKQIVINVISFICIVMIMAVMNRLTITTREYENRYWQAGWVHADMTIRETKLISREVVNERFHNDVQWYQGLGEFLNDTSRNGVKIVSIGFR